MASRFALTMMLLACGTIAARAQNFPGLDAAERQRLAVEARNPVHDPWQRDLMGDLAGGPVRSGAASRRDAATAWSSSVDGSWVLETPPGSRSGHSAVYDPIRQRMLVFGGLQGTYRNDVWALSLSGTPTWTKLVVPGAPSPRAGHSAIWDPARNRMVIFAGISAGNTYLNDTWALSFPPSGPVWTELGQFGTKPPVRAYQLAVYDSDIDCMRIGMGLSASGGYFTDVWSLGFSSDSWGPEPIGIIPPGRAQAVGMCDPFRYPMLICGGVGPGNSGSSDCWFYNGGWNFLLNSGLPSPRYGASSYRDAANGRMVVFGGRNSTTYFNETWALNLSTPAWAPLAVGGPLPPGRSAHSGVFIPTQNRMVIYGGSDAVGPRNDLWQLDMGGTPTWSALTVPGLPRPRTGRGAVLDLPRHRILVFGGTDGTTFFDDVESRALVGAGDWSPVVTTGVPPSARANHSLLYDANRDRLLVFGGSNGGAGFNDTWALDLSADPTWAPLVTSGLKPPGRSGQAAVLDPIRDRMLVFGGRSGAVFLGDVWELTLGATPTWTQLTPSGTPPSARGFQSAIYDPLRDQVVVFGGSGNAGSLADVWVLSLSPTLAWTQLPLVGPSARNSQATIHDANGDRLVIFGGRNGGTLFDDVWALPLAPGSDWMSLMPENADSKPSARSEASAIYDPNQDRMVLFGGRTAFGMDQDTWSLVWSPRAAVGPPASLAHVWLAPARPTPSRGDVEISYALPHASAATLAIYDLSGRAVRTLMDGSLPAGPGSIRWDRRTTGGELAPPGVYLYELNVAGQRQAKRLVLMP